MSAYSIAHGDVLSVLAGFRDNSFDALACDPPYGLRFMSKKWDYDVPSTDIWRECLRVLKPGAPLVAFGGSRTYHRLACGIEDAGAELRDQLLWLYGKGFPKSLDVCKAVDAKSPGDGGQWHGYGTALKPAHEPIVLARKPLDGTVAQNVARWGVGGLAIDACRIGNEDGRWPANLVLSHTADCRCVGTKKVKTGVAVKRNGVTGQGSVFAGTGIGLHKPGTPDSTYAGADGLETVEAWECSDDCPIRLLDAEAGHTTSVPYRANDAGGAVLPMKKRTAGGYADSGGPSRFFYCSKVSTREREAGCGGLALRSAGEVTDREDDSDGLDNPRAGAGRTGGARNHHPTLKPISLTTWLTRLILPPTAAPVLLVPFAGAGSEMIGALKAGWAGVFGIEREADYVEIARRRLAHWVPEGREAA